MKRFFVLRNIILTIALILGLSPSFNYVSQTLYDSYNLIGRDYLHKRDYIEAKYNGYLVYRYYQWLEETLPKNASYGVVASSKDGSLKRKYTNKLNYFLYPRHVFGDSSRALFAPRLATLPIKTDKNGNKYIANGGAVYYLDRGKDGAGVFIKR